MSRNVIWNRVFFAMPLNGWCSPSSAESSSVIVRPAVEDSPQRSKRVSSVKLCRVSGIDVPPSSPLFLGPLHRLGAGRGERVGVEHEAVRVGLAHVPLPEGPLPDLVLDLL